MAGGGGADDWRCRKHPAARSGGGVCPYCLRDRLLRLCPNCARVRPCPCAASPSSSSSASGDAVGRVHSLIEREHRIARSRSVAAGSSAAFAAAAPASGGSGRRKARVWGWPPFWKRDAELAEEDEEDEEEGLGLPRSSSVSATAVEAKTAAAAARARWGWHFPSPLKAFRHRRSSASVAGRA